MAKVWLDVATPVAGLHADCIRRAMACEPGMFSFCVFDEGRGFRELDAASVRAALAQLDAPAEAAGSPHAPGFRQRVKQVITHLPAGLQAPAMAAARAGARWLDGAGPAQTGAPVPVAKLVSPFAESDVVVLFSPREPLAAGLNLRMVKADSGSDPARVLRQALVTASQGGAGFEDRLQHLYTALLQDGDLCIDIGAHTGRHSLPMSWAVGSGRVEAFEPNPAVAQRLRARLECLAAPNITVNELALSDEAGMAEFVIAVDLPEESGLKERTIYNGPTRTERVTVRLGRLDGLDFENPRFIKLDTEGAEYKVLLGARGTVGRWRPVVAFEFGEASYAAYGVDPAAVFDYFDSLGYDVMSIHGDRLRKAAFVEASRVQKYWDYVACDSASTDRIASILLSFDPTAATISS